MIARLFQDWLERLSHRLRPRARCPICGEKTRWGRCQTLIHVVGSGGILEGGDTTWSEMSRVYPPTERVLTKVADGKLWYGTVTEREDC
jgi:hypothetical protein